jgi:hypothetical protein
MDLCTRTVRTHIKYLCKGTVLRSWLWIDQIDFTLAGPVANDEHVQYTQWPLSTYGLKLL